LLCIICKYRDQLLLFKFLIYNRIEGKHPYLANDERRLLQIIRSQKLRYDSQTFINLSSEGFFVIISESFHSHTACLGLDFLQGMLVYDTVHRRTMGELTVHPWLTVYSYSKH
jgi:serine/threonine protein kinase